MTLSRLLLPFFAAALTGLTGCSDGAASVAKAALPAALDLGKTVATQALDNSAGLDRQPAAPGDSTAEPGKSPDSAPAEDAVVPDDKTAPDATADPELAANGANELPEFGGSQAKPGGSNATAGEDLDTRSRRLTGMSFDELANKQKGSSAAQRNLQAKRVLDLAG